VEGSDHEKKRFCRRAIGSIAVLTLWAILLSALLLSAANDMLAFVKSEEEVTLELCEPQTAYALACCLEERGVVRHPLLFTLYLRVKNQTAAAEGFCGTLSLNASMSYREILTELKNTPSGE
jgi:cell division protein YceG involved in septum cleavage